MLSCSEPRPSLTPKSKYGIVKGCSQYRSRDTAARAFLAPALQHEEGVRGLGTDEAEAIMPFETLLLKERDRGSVSASSTYPVPRRGRLAVQYLEIAVLFLFLSFLCSFPLWVWLTNGGCGILGIQGRED
jgi:hypothetical protein